MIASLFVVFTTVIKENTARVAKTVPSQQLVCVGRLLVASNADLSQAWIAAKTFDVDVVATLCFSRLSSFLAERL